MYFKCSKPAQVEAKRRFFILLPFQIMRIVSEKLEAENSWVLERQEVKCHLLLFLSSIFIMKISHVHVTLFNNVAY